MGIKTHRNVTFHEFKSKDLRSIENVFNNSIKYFAIISGKKKKRDMNYVYAILILLSHLQLGFSKSSAGFFFPIKLYHRYSVLATYPTHLFLLELVIL
jgi:hypothetical protein